MKQSLRPYQQEAVDRCREAAAKHKRVLLQLPTGGGKTTIAAEIIFLAVSKGKTVLFLAHRRELIFQAYDRFSGFGLDCSIVLAGDKRCISEKPVQVGSVQTCVRRKKYMASLSPDLIIVDEAHHAVANSYVIILKMYPDAVVMGLSATPYRADGKGLGSIDDYTLFKGLVAVETTGSLVEQGYLSPCEVWVPQMINFSKIKIEKGDFAKKELEQIFVDRDLMENVARDWKKYCNGMQTLVFASSVQHSISLCAVFNEKGISAAHIDGTTPKAEREKILQKLGNGSVRVVSNFGVLTEGFDCPAVSALILARPTMSMALYKQMVGRGLRINAGKERAVMLDYGKNVTRHTWPTNDPAADLSAGLSSKPLMKNRKDGENGAWVCPRCLAAVPIESVKCKCGFKKEEKETKARKKEYSLKRLREDQARIPLTQGEIIKRRMKFFELEERDKKTGRSKWVSCYKYKHLYGKYPHEDGILSGGETFEYWRLRKKRSGNGAKS
tara:strand:- start:15324 stop:16817 length:1494 start_codon:yes stop_codon:yes gene_type:complete